MAVLEVGVGVGAGVAVGLGVGEVVGVGVTVGVGVGLTGVRVGVGVATGALSCTTEVPALTTDPVGTLEANKLSTGIEAGPVPLRATYCALLFSGRFFPSSTRKNLLSAVRINLDPAAFATDKVAQVPGSKSLAVVG